MKNLAWLLIIISVNAFSVEFVRSVNTFHIGQDMYNRTDLIGVEYKNVLAATFVNSYHERSYMLAYNLGYESERFEAGLYVGGVSGYCYSTSLMEVMQGQGVFDRSECGLFPVVAPSVKIKNGNASLGVSVFGNAVVTTVSMGF